jgi:hypothetical protein
MDATVEEIQTTTLTPYQNKLRLNRKYYQKKYNDNVNGFREKEIERSGIRVKNRYATDPEYRQMVIDAAKSRYHRLKSERQSQDS